MSVLLYLFIGYSSFGSGCGTLNLYSARTLPMGNLSFNMHLSYAQQSYPSQLGDGFETVHHTGFSKMGFTYGIVDLLEFYLGTAIYGKGEQRGGFGDPEDEYMFGIRDLYGGLKFYVPVVKGEDNSFGWLVGGNVRGSISLFHSAKDDSLTVNQHFESFMKNKGDISLDLLSDIEIYPLIFHLNGGYEFRGDNDDIPGIPIPDTVYFRRAERENLIKWGVGLEIVAGPNVRFMLETKGINPVDNGTDTVMAAFGLRFMSPDKFGFDVGVDYILNDNVDFVPDWENVGGRIVSRIEDASKWRFKVGITVTGDLIPEKKEVKPKKGVIALSVNDIDTDEPLGALVSFRDTTVGIFQTDKNGKAKISLLPGLYHIKVSKEGYTAREASVTVEAASEVNINTVLRKKKERRGMFTGTVSSYREKTPLAANIEFLGTEMNPIASDPEKGIFKAELPTGTYNINVFTEGYLPKTFPIEIRDGETTVKNIQLMEKLEEKKKLVLRGINFSSGKSTILPEGYAILDKVVEVLKANKDVKVEISGHTDAVGSASYNQRLSEARAQSVRQYLIEHGLDTSRLVARGYGESKPIAPNTTREGRAQNRRIEFTVISQ